MKALYHEGELAVQARAGVQEIASRVGRSIRSMVPPAAQDFLRNQPMAVIGSVDSRGHVWASLLTGEPGFMRVIDERTLRIDAEPITGDPLSDNIKAEAQVGILAIEPATRRRMRLNGHVLTREQGGITIAADQVYSNCPKYIQAREWEVGAHVPEDQATSGPRRSSSLNGSQQQWIAQADTFFIATAHKQAGADASHRGGSPGFVRVLNDNALAWGDYSGNGMFQTLGNINANPNAGLLFLDFERGSILQLAGRAQVVWDAGRAAEFAGAERVVEFHIDDVIETRNATRLRWRLIDYSPFNPS